MQSSSAPPSTAARGVMAVLASPFGPIHVATDGRAVVRVELRTTPEVFAAAVTRRLGGPVVRASEAAPAQRRVLEQACAELEAYLAGTRAAFDVPVALPGRSDWDRRVLEAVRRIPFGQVSSYGRIATVIGARGAARAVGGAVGRNPIGLIIPCHRVIAGDGSLGGYGGSWAGDVDAWLDLKRALLAHEGVDIPARDRLR